LVNCGGVLNNLSKYFLIYIIIYIIAFWRAKKSYDFIWVKSIKWYFDLKKPDMTAAVLRRFNNSLEHEYLIVELKTVIWIRSISAVGHTAFMRLDLRIVLVRAHRRTRDRQKKMKDGRRSFFLLLFSFERIWKFHVNVIDIAKWSIRIGPDGNPPVVRYPRLRLVRLNRFVGTI